MCRADDLSSRRVISRGMVNNELSPRVGQSWDFLAMSRADRSLVVDFQIVSRADESLVVGFEQ